MSSSSSSLDAQDILSDEDDRPLVRVFVASSDELRPERDALDQLIENDLANRPDVRRNARLQCLLWNEDASPGSPSEGINEQIHRALDLDDVDIVIALLWRKVGAGTKQEIERALERLLEVGRPRLLVYRKRVVALAGTTTVESANKSSDTVLEYCRSLVDRNLIVTEIDDADDLVRHVAQHLPLQLADPRAAPAEPRSPAALARGVRISGIAGVILTAATLILSSTMSFPDGPNVGFWTVLALLAAPPLLAAVAFFIRWWFGRLLNRLISTWFSPDYRDERLYLEFETFVPAQALPRRVRRQLSGAPGSDLVRWGLVSMFLLAPVIGQYQALFNEILLWELMVGTEVVVGRTATGAAICGEETPEVADPVVSCYVDRGRTLFPLRLQDQDVRDKQREDGDDVFVHAQGRFGHREGESRWRANRGPEVWPPWQPSLYLGLFIVTALFQAHGLRRLVLIARELRWRSAPAMRARPTS